MLLSNFTTFRYSFSRGIIYFMALIFSDTDDQFLGFDKCISSTLEWTALAQLLDYTEGSCSSTLVIYVSFLVFYFPFSQV